MEQNKSTVKDFYDYDALIFDLIRIVNNEYSQADSERNHQTFAAALMWIMKDLRYKL